MNKQHHLEYSEEITRSYDTRYVAAISHKGLGTYRVLKDLDKGILKNKISAQFSKWDEQWARIVQREQATAEKENSLAEAEARTEEARQVQKEMDDLLVYTLDVDDTVDWNTLKDRRRFTKPNPMNRLDTELQHVPPPRELRLKDQPVEPKWTDFEPKKELLHILFKSMKEKKLLKAKEEFESAMVAYREKLEETKKVNRDLEAQHRTHLQAHEDDKRKVVMELQQLEVEWEEEKRLFKEEQERNNQKVELMKEQYFQAEREAVIHYCELVLNNSWYPDWVKTDFEVDYIPESRILMVEYTLPSPVDIPTLLDVKFVATRKEMKESHMSATQQAKTYDDVIYKLTLRTLHEIFEADQADVIEAVVFNGWVNAINKGTGKQVSNCIVSIQAKKSEFMEIELSNVEPKLCFKNLKGIGSSKLSGITAIQPIAQISREDKRFTSSYQVADNLAEGDNLAAMDWEDFEHLLRELFEKEFQSNGGEVKVTQASRDGGVDAIAFDPDPIRGGKIVIQAKRYTNTVGVSAVRDLYGTVMNEGATKGILVTTADFGPDAYQFASNKPITLMNGANLLYLLEKHGHKARIDLAEAKKLMTG